MERIRLCMLSQMELMVNACNKRWTKCSECKNPEAEYLMPLKVPKFKIFDRSDFQDFYAIKPFWVGDFGVKK